MEKIRPKGPNAIISLVIGISLLCLVPIYFAIFKIVLNLTLIMVLLLILFGGIFFCSEFYGSKITYDENEILIYKWYKVKYRITLSEVTDARLGNFCKCWWSISNTVISAKVFTKDKMIEFPLVDYSKKQNEKFITLLKEAIKK